MKTKTCCKCDLTKDIEDFCLNRETKDGRNRKCKKCAAEENRNLTHKEYDLSLTKECKICHKEKQLPFFDLKKDGALGRSNIFKECRKAIAKEFVDKAKNNPCVSCGKTYEPILMDFDHKDRSTKHKSVSSMVFNSYSLHLIEKEVEKCDLLCIFCHKRKTFEENRIKKEQSLKNKTLGQINQINKKKILINKINLLKDKPCEECGIKYEPFLMEYDHLNQKDKLSTISILTNKNIDYDIVKAEIDKCRLLCCGCHRKHTYKQMQNCLSSDDPKSFWRPKREKKSLNGLKKNSIDSNCVDKNKIE